MELCNALAPSLNLDFEGDRSKDEDEDEEEDEDEDADTGDEGESKGEATEALASEPEYSLTYRCLDLLYHHVHKKEDKRSNPGEGREEDSEGIFSVLSSYSDDYVARSGFFVQPPVAFVGHSRYLASSLHSCQNRKVDEMFV
jgi:hypothetical protein